MRSHTIRPQPLSKKARVALSGLLYRAFADGLEDEPGDPEIWAGVKRANEAVLAGKDMLSTFGIFPNRQAARQAAMNSRFGGLVDLILQREGIVADDESRTALLEDAALALSEATEKLHRNAKATTALTQPPSAFRLGRVFRTLGRPSPQALHLMSCSRGGGWRPARPPVQSALGARISGSFGRMWAMTIRRV